MNRYSTKPFIDTCRCLSIRNLIDLGCFRPGWTGKIIVFSRKEDGQDVPDLRCKPESEEDGTYHVDVSCGYAFLGKFMGTRYRIRLVGLSAHFGGMRYQFECPGDGCGRKVRKLYLVGDGVKLLCRRCHGLRYRSSNGDYPKQGKDTLPRMRLSAKLRSELEALRQQESKRSPRSVRE
jgi:hypothetical protein